MIAGATPIRRLSSSIWKYPLRQARFPHRTHITLTFPHNNWIDYPGIECSHDSLQARCKFSHSFLRLLIFPPCSLYFPAKNKYLAVSRHALSRTIIPTKSTISRCPHDVAKDLNIKSPSQNVNYRHTLSVFSIPSHNAQPCGDVHVRILVTKKGWSSDAWDQEELHDEVNGVGVSC